MKKRWGCIGIVLLVLFCLSALLNLLLIGAVANKAGTELPAKLPRFGEQLVARGSTTDKIAIIDLRGLISSSISGAEGETMVDDIKIELQQALDDSKVKAIVLSVDSPGGEVTASDAIYNAVRRARAKKPVVVYMGSLAASGGYYVSCGGSYLMASASSLTGSIGVIIEGLNYSQLLGKIGLSPMVFKSGKFKDMLSGATEMSDDEKQYVQQMVGEAFDQFENIVSQERKIPLEVLNDKSKPIADGRVISGRDALTDKLIDGLGEIENAIDKARDLGGAPGAGVVRYKPSFGLGRFFKMFGESSQSRESKIEVNLTQRLMPPLEPGKLYMLPDFYAQ